MRDRKKYIYIVVSVLVIALLIVVFIILYNRKSSGKASSGNIVTTNINKEKAKNNIENSTQETTLTQETTTAGQPSVPTKTLYVIANGANARDNYENGAIVGHLNQNDAVVVVGEPIADSSGTLWYQLDNGNYVCADLLGEQPIGSGTSNTPSSGGSSSSGRKGSSNVGRNGSNGGSNDYDNNDNNGSDYGDNSGNDNGGNSGDNNNGGGTSGDNGGGSTGLNTSYVGFRPDCDQAFRSPFLSMRANEIPKFGWTGDIRNRLINATWNESLYHVAQARAKEIVANFSHDSAGNVTSGYCLNEAIAINNIVSNDSSESANRVLNGWYNSQGHYNVITHGDQYAVACYQYKTSLFWVFVSGDYNMYCADAYATYNSWAWQECGFSDEASYRKSLYDEYVADYGNRIIQ